MPSRESTTRNRNRLPARAFREIGRSASDWLGYLDWSAKYMPQATPIGELDPVTREWVECLLQRRAECRRRLVRLLRKRGGEPIDAWRGWTLHLSADGNGLAFINANNREMDRGVCYRPGTPMPPLWSHA